jgi:HEAT repeat protein
MSFLLLQATSQNTKILGMKTKIISNIIVCVFLFSASNVCAATKKQVKSVSNKTSAKSVPAEIVKPKTPFESALEKIKSDNPIIRRTGAVQFARLRDKKAIDPLFKLLSDKDASVRAAAVDALGLLRAKKALPEISKLLLKDKDERVRHTAAISLSYIGGKDAGESLVKAMDDKSVGVSYAAIRTLAVLRYAKAQEKLIKFLKKKDVNMRRSVINTLGKIRSAESVKHISAYYDDKDTYVRREVAKALGEIGDEKSITTLKKMLKDTEESIQIEAAYALAKMKDSSGLLMAHKFIKSDNRLMKQSSSSIMALVGDENSLKILNNVYTAEKNSSIKSFIDFSRSRLISRLKLKKKK